MKNNKILFLIGLLILSLSACQPHGITGELNDVSEEETQESELASDAATNLVFTPVPNNDSDITTLIEEDPLVLPFQHPG